MSPLKNYMAKFLVKGGNKLNGTVTVSGSKNAALPIMCAALLSKKKILLKNVPDITDKTPRRPSLQDASFNINARPTDLEIWRSKNGIPRRMRSWKKIGPLTHPCIKRIRMYDR